MDGLAKSLTPESVTYTLCTLAGYVSASNERMPCNLNGMTMAQQVAMAKVITALDLLGAELKE